MLIFINGNIVSERDAKISVFDRGFLYGDGVFETLRAYGGKLFHYDRHIDRFFTSADAIRLEIPYTRDYLEGALYKTLKENFQQDATLRMSVTRGKSTTGLDIGREANPTLVIISREFNGYPEGLYKKGISAAIVNTKRTPSSALNPEIKSLNFLNNIMARVEATDLKASEGFMLSMEGYVAEGTVCNIFIVMNGVIKTPPLSTGILNGVTRSVVIGLAKEQQLPLSEEPFYPEELYRAGECFVTSTLYEVMPVITVNDRKIGNGQPGEITKKLLNGFRNLTSPPLPPD